MNRHAEILHELVRADVPTEPPMDELSGFGTDLDQKTWLVLSRDGLLRTLDRYLAGEITAGQLRQWAENLEAREDVVFDKAAEMQLDAVFQQLTGTLPLTRESVLRLRGELVGSPASA